MCDNWIVMLFFAPKTEFNYQKFSFRVQLRAFIKFICLFSYNKELTTLSTTGESI